MTVSHPLAQDICDRFADTALRVGTRTTPLAMAQTRHVLAAIEAVVPGMTVEVVPIQTSADMWTG